MHVSVGISWNIGNQAGAAFLNTTDAFPAVIKGQYFLANDETFLSTFPIHLEI